ADLYRRQSTANGNLFFSPYSISAALAMTYAGAGGQTATEMAHVLHFDLPQSDVPAAFAVLARELDAIGNTKPLILEIANSLWCQQGFPFSDLFLKQVRDSYRAEARLVDFARNAEPTRLEINSWVAQKTNDKIRDLLKPGQVTGATRLVLCNAIY